MRLKSLEIIGFKSFVDRTVINFEEGITGIVGPNGCGKSNLVDAIRWVMGEQSAKHLRGGSMEDVIFSGSATRQPVGMAQVFLTFDNSNGRAPAQYADLSEIQVGRRLYRSGESEYFINKAQCRLKDIIDLFLDTGIGTKAYSIVEQGMVGQAVSARPLDRRNLIEEAAGISKFKSRKEAALRRIDSTQANLLRLTDILTELQRQINSLNRQAKKAERYQHIADELKERELALSLYRYEELNGRLKSLEAEKESRTESEASLSSELSRCEADIESLRIAAAEVEKELESVQEELYATNQSIKLNESEMEHKTKEADDLVERGGNLEEELVGLNERLQMLAWRLEKANQEIVEADCTLVSLNESALSLEGEVEGLREGKSELTEESQEKQRQLLADTSSLSELKAKLNHLERRLVEISDRITKDQAEVETIDRRREKAVVSINECQRSLEGAKELKHQVGNERSSKRDNLIQLKNSLKDAEQRVRELTTSQNTAKSKLESIEEMRKNLDGYRDGVKNVILRSKEAQENLKGILGTVGEIVETDPVYEMAVSAVLGDRLQFVVVESHQEGIEAIEYLKTASNGRSSFIPLNIRTNTFKTAPVQGEGIVGPLSEYVRFTDDFKPVANYLFSDVVVVEDLRKALKYWETQETNHTYVTLDGEVVSPSGVITGGIGGDADASLIAQRRKINELKEEIAAREKTLNTAEEEAHRLNETVKTLEQELERMDRESHDLEIKLVGQEHGLEGVNEELARLDSEHERLVMETAALTEEKNQCEHERTSTTLRCEQLETDKHQWEESLKDISSRLESLNNDLTGRDKKLVDLKVSIAQAEERQAAIGREIEQSVSLKSELALDIGRKQDDITRGSQKVVVLRREVEERKEALNTFVVKIEKLTMSQREMQERCNHATQEIRNRELSVREIRKRRDEALSASHDTALKLTELREKARYLVEGIRERYKTDLTAMDKTFINYDLNMEEEEAAVNALKEKVEKLGSVNVDAIKEYEELYDRHQFISKQHADLTTSLDALKHAITKINRISRERFRQTFDNVNEKFQEVFPKLFEGGKARLILTDEDNLLESGVEIIVQPPGKRLQSISLLSGGEKALTAVAFIFSIFLTKPSPFCLLDEVDAPLDDANVDRFNGMIRSMTCYSQFVLITHNKRTMELADLLYGVTMEEPGVSKMVSVRLSRDADQPTTAVA